MPVAIDMKGEELNQHEVPLPENQPLSCTTVGRADGDQAQPVTDVERGPAELFAENVIAKVLRTGTKHLTTSAAAKHEASQNGTISPSPRPVPRGFPEFVPQAGDDVGVYTLREPEFWTCGFFPGTLYSILERLVRFPRTANMPPAAHLNVARVRSEVQSLCDAWSEPLHNMANRQDTHDLGFIIMPALRKRWELTDDTRSLETIIRAARSLASRYLPGARAIRSWDERIQKNIRITCRCQNALLIIDSMCNLDLLYYAASHAAEGGAELYDVATTHASTLLRTHLRPETGMETSGQGYAGQWYSTHHVVNVHPDTGKIQQAFTAQGYSDMSLWARGQAWAILGYAQTYMWTKDRKFLDAACGLAEHFLYRMETSEINGQTNGKGDENNGRGASETSSSRRYGGRYVPLWDFDAPIDDPSNPTRDSSAGSIAANGMLVISQALAGLGDDRLAARFRTAALAVVQDLLDFALAPETARLVCGAGGEISVEDTVPGETFEALMKYGTVNNNSNAMRRCSNHGIVYGDYYLVEFGNRLLRMGLM